MNCPICNQEMQEGMLVAFSSRMGWRPNGKLNKFPRLTEGFTMKDIGDPNTSLFLGYATAPGAYYCEHCQKVTGIFDVTF